MTDADDWNTKIIEEFRANGGKVGGQLEGAPLLLLHTIGARTGKERVSPMMYQDLGGAPGGLRLEGGCADRSRLVPQPRGQPGCPRRGRREVRSFRARVATGDERERIWSTQKERYPGFADYEARTDRQIPVVILEPE